MDRETHAGTTEVYLWSSNWLVRTQYGSTYLGGWEVALVSWSRTLSHVFPRERGVRAQHVYRVATGARHELLTIAALYCDRWPYTWSGARRPQRRAQLVFKQIRSPWAAKSVVNASEQRTN